MEYFGFYYGILHHLHLLQVHTVVKVYKDVTLCSKKIILTSIKKISIDLCSITQPQEKGLIDDTITIVKKEYPISNISNRV